MNIDENQSSNISNPWKLMQHFSMIGYRQRNETDVNNICFLKCLSVS